MKSAQACLFNRTHPLVFFFSAFVGLLLTGAALGHLAPTPTQPALIKQSSELEEFIRIRNLCKEAGGKLDKRAQGPTTWYPCTVDGFVINLK